MFAANSNYSVTEVSRLLGNDIKGGDQVQVAEAYRRVYARYLQNRLQNLMDIQPEDINEQIADQVRKELIIVRESNFSTPKLVDVDKMLKMMDKPSKKKHTK